MEDHFHRNGEAFEELVTMFTEDSNIPVVSSEAGPFFPDPSAVLSDTRLAKYRDLLDKTGCRDIVRRDDGVIACVYAATLWAEYKHFLHSAEPPGPLYDDLDDLPDLPPSEAAYKQLNDRWYLEFYYTH